MYRKPGCFWPKNEVRTMHIFALYAYHSSDNNDFHPILRLRIKTVQRDAMCIYMEYKKGHMKY